MATPIELFRKAFGLEREQTRKPKLFTPAPKRIQTPAPKEQELFASLPKGLPAPEFTLPEVFARQRRFFERGLEEEAERQITAGKRPLFQREGQTELEALKEQERLFQSVDFPIAGTTRKLISPARQHLKKLVAEQVAERKKAAPSLLKRVKTLVPEIKQKFVDSLSPIEDTFRKAQKEFKFEQIPAKSFNQRVAEVYRAPALANQFAKDNGLEQVIKNAPDLDELGQYLIAKRAREVSGRGIKTGRNLDLDSQLIDELSETYEPFARTIKTYTDNLLDVVADSGVISRELATNLKTNNQSYVPINRIIEETRAKGKQIGRGVASLGDQNVVQRLKGSERVIDDPITNLLDLTARAHLQASRNNAAKSVAQLADIPELAGFRRLKSGERAAHTISYLDNGVKKKVAVPRGVEEAARNLAPQHFGLAAQIFAVPNRVFKAGTTGLNPAFIFKNAPRDQLSALIFSKGYKGTVLGNPLSFVRGLLNATKRGDLYDDWIRSAGGGTGVDLSRSALPKTIGAIRASRGKFNKAKFLVKNPSQLFRALEDTVSRAEELTRIQQFDAARRVALKEGRTLADANAIAAQASRENTIDFTRRGEWGTVINSVIPYINARIQGSRLFVRRMKEDPVNTSIKIGTTIFMPIAATTAWNLATPERRAAYEDISDIEKDLNLIIVPPNPEQDEDGRWNVIKIPLPQDLAAIGTTVRKQIESINGVDELRFKDVYESLVAAVSPVTVGDKALVSSITPQALKVPIELQTNQSLFTGRPIVPRRLEGVSPELQTEPGVSGTAELLARPFGASPIKTEFGIGATFGGLGSQVLNLSDRALAALGVISETQIGGKPPEKEIEKVFKKAYGGAKSKKIIDKVIEIEQRRDDQKAMLHNRAEAAFTELKSLEKAEANRRLGEIEREAPDLFKEIVDIKREEDLGITPAERFIKSLGVANGDRARFVLEQVQDLKTAAEKNKLIGDWERKGIISERVLKQIAELRRSQREAPQTE